MTDQVKVQSSKNVSHSRKVLIAEKVKALTVLCFLVAASVYHCSMMRRLKGSKPDEFILAYMNNSSCWLRCETSSPHK